MKGFAEYIVVVTLKNGAKSVTVLLKKPKGEAKLTTAAIQCWRTYGSVAIDVLGSLPETEHGNKYIHIALPNQEAVTVANFPH